VSAAYKLFIEKGIPKKRCDPEKLKSAISRLWRRLIAPEAKEARATCQAGFHSQESRSSFSPVQGVPMH